MRAYSMDLRVRVLADGDEGVATAAVARKHRVSPAWVRRLKPRRAATGETAPRPGGRRVPVLTTEADRIRAAIADAPEGRLAKATADDPLVQQLLALKGIGLVTAATIRAEIGRFDRFRTGKQMARFCGLTPRNASSGQKQADAGLIKAGNPQLRATLIETAHRLIRYDAQWKKLAAGMKARGKPGSLVAAAVANRWVRWLFHQTGSPATAA